MGEDFFSDSAGPEFRRIAERLCAAERRVGYLESAIKRLLDGNRQSLELNLDALRDALDAPSVRAKSTNTEG